MSTRSSNRLHMDRSSESNPCRYDEFNCLERNERHISCIVTCCNFNIYLPTKRWKRIPDITHHVGEKSARDRSCTSLMLYISPPSLMPLKWSVICGSAPGSHAWHAAVLAGRLTEMWTRNIFFTPHIYRALPLAKIYLRKPSFLARGPWRWMAPANLVLTQTH